MTPVLLFSLFNTKGKHQTKKTAANLTTVFFALVLMSVIKLFQLPKMIYDISVENIVRDTETFLPFLKTGFH